MNQSERDFNDKLDDLIEKLIIYLIERRLKQLEKEEANDQYNRYDQRIR